MKMTFLLLLAMSLAAPATMAKTDKVRSTKLPNGLAVQEYRMDNGLQLLFVQDKSAPVFTFQMWFKVGSATEKMDPKLQRTGLAHLFEHMMFRGTPANPDGQFDVKMSSAGATGLNATTWLDRTNYFESLPKDKLELAFQLESDRMANLAIDEKLFKTELGAVFGERKMGRDKPARIASEETWELAFDKHPYKWSTIGTTEELNSFTVEEANYFYKTYYAPNNAVLILLGDFDISKAIQLAERYYGKMKAQEIPNVQPAVEATQEKARSKEVSHPLATSDILSIGYRIPDMRSPDLSPLNVLGTFLAVGNGSVLEQELVQEGIASSVSAGPMSNRYPTIFEIQITMAPGKNVSKAQKVLREAFERIRKGDVSTAEIERARNQYLLSSYNQLLNQSTIGSWLGEAFVSSDNYSREFEILEGVKTVSLADLQRVVNSYFKDEQSNTVHVVPGKGDN